AFKFGVAHQVKPLCIVACRVTVYSDFMYLNSVLRSQYETVH
ncbi:MAG: hypothetical protein RLZZ434_994, partial [Pseudomonadota bacterium]